MSPRKKAQAAFASAVLLLFLSAIAGYFSIDRLLRNEKWVLHTYDVRNALGDLDWAILKAGRARTAYVTARSDDSLNQFESAVAEITPSLQHLCGLTRDNPKQLELCSRLEEITARRVALLRKSVQSAKESPLDDAAQHEFTRQNVPISSEMIAVMEQMRDQERNLLAVRQKMTRRLFVLMVVILAVAGVLALQMFAVHFRFLSAELEAREEAERSARNSEESLRRLAGRLLQLQDAERRKFSRELHDSLGQYLVGVKMNLELYADQANGAYLTEAMQLLGEAIAETRTISHLLHPPLLDEAGFSSAARWYLEGFAQRSGIEVKVDLPEDARRLPRPLALGLFRVLQESLTNIHRHSGSTKAEIALTILRDRVMLKVRDYGKGIAPETLDVFRAIGINSGVGLAGMRERVRELGGQLTIEACAPGILISASLPLSEMRTAANL